MPWIFVNALGKCVDEESKANRNLDWIQGGERYLQVQSSYG